MNNKKYVNNNIVTRHLLDIFVFILNTILLYYYFFLSLLLIANIKMKIWWMNFERVQMDLIDLAPLISNLSSGWFENGRKKTQWNAIESDDFLRLHRNASFCCRLSSADPITTMKSSTSRDGHHCRIIINPMRNYYVNQITQHTYIEYHMLNYSLDCFIVFSPTNFNGKSQELFLVGIHFQ